MPIISALERIRSSKSVIATLRDRGQRGMYEATLTEIDE